MVLSRRQKLTIVSLTLYWPAMFILTHIPVPALRYLAAPPLTDKVLHYLVYLILVFLLWFSLNPEKKVNWRRAPVWWVLLVVVWYGVLDEWLQGYVGRDPDVMDFFADLAGALTGLILLSVFHFWAVCLVMAGAVIFIATNITDAVLADLSPVTAAAFHLLAYAIFSLSWIRYIHHFLPVQAPELRWLIGALSLPAGLMLATTLFTVVADNDLSASRVIVSAAAIAVIVGAAYLNSLIRKPRTSGRNQTA